MAKDVWAWCERMQVFGRTVTVKIKFADFHQATRSRSFRTPAVTREQILRASLELVRSVFPLTQAVRLVGVAVSNFPEASPMPNDQLPLFHSKAASADAISSGVLRLGRP